MTWLLTLLASFCYSACFAYFSFKSSSITMSWFLWSVSKHEKQIVCMHSFLLQKAIIFSLLWILHLLSISCNTDLATTSHDSFVAYPFVSFCLGSLPNTSITLIPINSRKCKSDDNWSRFLIVFRKIFRYFLAVSMSLFELSVFCAVLIFFPWARAD